MTLLQPFTNRVSVLVDATEHLRPHGATSLYDGIYEAADYLSLSPGRRVIIVVSDGGDTTSKNDFKQTLKKAQQSDAVLYAVFTGNSYLSENLRDPAAERVLQELTGETGGEVYQPKVKDEDTAEEALRELDKD